MAGPNASEVKIRTGFETFRGSGRTTAWHDLRPSSEGGETLGAEFPTIADVTILGDGEEPEGLDTKIDPSGDFNAGWSPEEHEPLIAGFFGASGARTEAPTGVYTTKYAVSESSILYDSLVVEVNRDFTPVLTDLYLSALVQQLTFSASARSQVTGAASLVIPRLGTQDEATQTVGTSTDPIVRGLLDYASLGTPSDTRIQVTDAAPGDGSDFHIKVKRGAASTYDGAAIPIFIGTWTPITDENDAEIGLEGAAFEVYWADATGIAALDEWTIPDTRGAWVRSVPVRSPLNEISATILADGVKFRTRDFNLTLTRPAALDEAIGGRFVDDIIEQGDRTTSGQLNRRVLDRSVINRIMGAQNLSIRIDMLGTLIGATGVRRRLSLIMMNCKLSGRTPSVTNRDTFDEAIDFRAHPSVDVTYPSAITAEVVNSIASLV